jgi:hypothetical protein
MEQKFREATAKYFSILHSACERILQPSKTAKLTVLALAVFLLTLGMMEVSSQALNESGSFDESRFQTLNETFFDLLEGSFGALLMIIAGFIAIVSMAFGFYRAALAALLVAIGAFILRPFVGMFFEIE